MHRARHAAIAAALFLTPACSTDSGTGPVTTAVASVDLIEVQPLLEGAQILALARTFDAQGALLTGRTLNWSSSDASVVTVSEVGLLKGIAAGAAYVRVTSEGKRDSILVAVVPIPVASVQVEADTARVGEGLTRQLVATPKDEAGRPLTGRFIQWTSDNPLVAAVTVSGVVTALQPGVAHLQARVDNRTGVMTMIVSADYDFDLIYDVWNGVRAEPSALYRQDVRLPGSMGARVLPSGTFGTAAAPSPDGTRLAFSGYIDGHSQIQVANTNGSGVITRIAPSAFEDDEASWSPDGTRIAFRRWELVNGTGHADIWVVNADGSNAVKLTADQGLTNQMEPAWSPRQPDGSYRLVYSSQSNDSLGRAHLWTMKPDGSDKRPLTTGNVYDTQPSWSPDGATIAFQRSTDMVGGKLYLIDADGASERRLLPVDLAFGQFHPAWSPDGKLIAFASKHEGGMYQIYTVWGDGSKMTRRTTGEAHHEHPVWIKR